MAVRAAVKGDIELLKLAVLQDPLVSSVCSSEEVWQMVDEMLVAQAQWLPQYKSKINSIKKNLKKIKNYKYNKSIKGLTKKTRRKQQKRSVLVEKEAFNL
jgi:alpha-galactosidase